ncbi:MAG: hypothetical protein IJH77_06690 [Mogibacterium sp.]|nr:hypothetical protein [Mogibacterium sp.]
MGLGMFIFLGRNAFYGAEKEHMDERILFHEYGHTLQSVILGPLFLPVIALPSLIWAKSRGLRRYRIRRNRSYYEFYPERWADALGIRYTESSRDH